MCQRLARNFLAGPQWKRQNLSGMSGNGAISGSLLADYFRIADDSGAVAWFFETQCDVSSRTVY
jgi:hypothetical protein